MNRWWQKNPFAQAMPGKGIFKQWLKNRRFQPFPRTKVNVDYLPDFTLMLTSVTPVGASLGCCSAAI